MAYNMFATPKMETKPIEVYDPNQGWRGAPSARNIAQAYNTPQAQLQTAQRQNQQQSMPEIKGSESMAGIDYLNALYTSPEQEEKMRKASVMNQRILAVGDAIRQIGNIANTVNGAPSQQLNNPIAEEQARYEKGKALRDKANLTYATYQQQKAIQDAKIRRFEAEQDYKNRMLAHYDDQERRLWQQQQETARKNSWNEALREREFELRKALGEGRISVAEFNAQTARMRALRTGTGGGRGKGMDEYTVTSNTVYDYDENGKKTGSTTTKSRTVNGKEQPTRTTGGNSSGSSNPYGGRKHGSGGKGKGNSGNKENKFGVRPAK